MSSEGQRDREQHGCSGPVAAGESEHHLRPVPRKCARSPGKAEPSPRWCSSPCSPCRSRWWFGDATASKQAKGWTGMGHDGTVIRRNRKDEAALCSVAACRRTWTAASTLSRKLGLAPATKPLATKQRGSRRHALNDRQLGGGVFAVQAASAPKCASILHCLYASAARQGCRQRKPAAAKASVLQLGPLSPVQLPAVLFRTWDGCRPKL